MDREDLLARVAWLYYVEELTQQEVGRQLNLPRVKITRLLKQARDGGVVEFRIAKPTAHLELERAIKQAFSLHSAWVVPTPLEGERLLPALGEAGARYLETILRPGLVVGLGMGRTLAQIPPFIDSNPEGHYVFIEMVGGAGRTDLGFDTYNVSWRMAERCSGSAEHLFCPVVVESAEFRSALLQDPQIAATLQRAAACDIALVGIGSVDEDALLMRLGYCDPNLLRDLQEQGAVGDILGHFFDCQGNPLSCELEQRLVALSLAQLRAIPIVVAMSGGPEKVAAIRGALRGGHIDVLVTDSKTAQAILEAHDGPEGNRS